MVSRPEPWRFRPTRFFQELNRAIERRTHERYWASLRTGVFHSTHFTTHAGLRIPQLLTVHDMLHEDYPLCFADAKLAPFIERKRRCAEAAAAIACDSQHTMDRVQHHHPFARCPIVVIPLAVDDAFRTAPDGARVEQFRARYAGGHRFALFVGTRLPHKNVYGLLGAYARWPMNAEVHLVSAGGQPANADGPKWAVTSPSSSIPATGRVSLRP